jgi:signal transduction histidine kinase
MKLSIKWKISIALLALVFCVFSTSVGIQIWINDSKAYGTIINLAGRQRMFTQKMTKEVMFIANGFDVREDMEKTQQLFERTLNGLIEGDNESGLPPAKTDEIRIQLQKVKGLWTKFKPEIIRAANGGFNVTGQKEKLYSASLEILKEMDKGVKMMELDSSKSIAKLRIYAVLALIFSLFIAAGVFYYIRKNVISKLRETVDAAEQLKDGDLSARINISSQDEIGQLSSVFNEMAETLKMKQKQEKTFQRKLQEETVLAQAKERRGIAQDVHDHLGHSLAILRMKIEDVKSKIADKSDNMKESLEDSILLIKEMIQQTRTLIFDLYPVMLDDFGILKTIEWHVKDYKSKTGLETKFVQAGTPAEPSRAVSIYLLRVIKELLNNALKHADADHVIVTVRGSDSVFEVIVSDDGKGFAPDNILKSPGEFSGIGIYSMREWVAGLEGKISIVSSPGSGTSVTIEIPLEKNN